MININYVRLFNLQISHSYFENQKARGITIKPTRRTIQLLKGGRMLFKKTPNGITVLYRANDDGTTPLVAIDSDLRLSFSLWIENKPQFFAVTNLDETPSKKFNSSNILYFSNDPAAASSDPNSPEEITHTLIESTKNSLFTYRFAPASGPAEILLYVRNDAGELVSVGKAANGSVLSTPLTLAKNDDGFYQQQIDLRHQPSGRHEFSLTEMDDTPINETVFYVDDELASKDLMGVVDIYYQTGSGHLYDATEYYELKFNRKETHWKYFIINKTKNVQLEDENLTINVLENDDNGSDPSGYASINFTREGPDPHNTIMVNNMETVVFRSNDVIPFRELTKTLIQLIKEPDGTVLINNLPNPSHTAIAKDEGGAQESEIYVFI